MKPALTSTTEGISLGDCVAQGRDYRAGLRKLRHKERSPDGFSLVLFCGDAGAYSIGDHWPAVGDPIYVALYDNGSIANVRFEPDCAAEQVAPRGNLSGSFNIKGVQSDTGYKVIPDLGSDTDPGLAWRCYNTDVEVVLYGQAPGKSKPEAVTRFTLKQAQRYHFTTQMGVLFTRDVEHQYVVSAASTIRDEGPVGTGPHYYASVVLYALPRQLETLFGGSYSGRDILHENEFADRLGLLFGVGLSEPSRELVAGLSFELLTGVNVTGAARWARFRQLDGVQVGDAFTGTSDSIPRQDRWQTSFVAGVALDLRYVTALFNRQ